MSTVLVIAPIISATWPVLAATITAVAHTTGFSTRFCHGNQNITPHRGSVDIQADHILDQNLEVDECLMLEREGVSARFHRNRSGGLQLCLKGTSHTQDELQKIGQELIGRVTQQYAYHRIITELKRRNLTIIDEEMRADQSVRIRVRNV